MTNNYIPTPKVSPKCDLCKKGKPYKYIVKEDPRKIAPEAISICKKCYKTST
jgi:hypothetical protein